MNTIKQYEKEQAERYVRNIASKQQNKSESQDNFVIKNKSKRKYKLSQELLVLDSNDRDRSLYPLPNDFILKSIEDYKNVVCVRIIRTEYSIVDAFTSIVVNNQPVPIQFFKPIHAFLYLNGYDKLKIANDSSTPVISQLAAGTDTFPPISGSLSMDPYAHIIRPMEKKLNRFHVKIVDNKGITIPIQEPERIRVVITIAVFTVV